MSTFPRAASILPRSAKSLARVLWGHTPAPLIIAPAILHQALDAAFYVLPFTASAIAGCIVGVLGLLVLQRAGVAQVAKAAK